MNQSRVEKLGALALSNLKLPSTDVTEDLVNSFRTYLFETDHTKDVVVKSMPKKRISIVKDFLNNDHSSGKPNKRHFWPARQSAITEPDITRELADFMCFDVGKIPRHTSEARKSKSSSTQPKLKPVEARTESQPDLQQHSHDIELATAAANRAMDKLDKQDPTYSEKASDFVQDTSRQTRLVNKISSTNSRTQPPFREDLNRSIPTLDGLPTTIPAHDEVGRRAAEIKVPPSHGLSASEQIGTPSPSHQRLGKRPLIVTDSFGAPRNEIFISEPLLETSLPRMRSPDAGPFRKQARLEEPSENMETFEHIIPHANPSSQLPSGNDVQQVRQTLDQSLDNTQLRKQGAKIHDAMTTREDCSTVSVSPPRVHFESYYPSTPRSIADVVVQCQITQPEAEPNDRIVIDFHRLQFAQLYELPLMFLDQLSESRRSHETVGTNEGRARAAVLRDVEEQFRKMLKGP